MSQQCQSGIKIFRHIFSAPVLCRQETLQLGKLLIETDAVMAEMKEMADKDIKTIINILSVYKDLWKTQT